MALVFSAAGFCNAVLSPLSLWWDSLHDGGESEVSDVFGSWSHPLWVIGAILALVSVLLFVGGIRLLNHSAPARSVLIVWSILKLIVSLPAAWLDYLFRHEVSFGAGHVGVFFDSGMLLPFLNLLWAWALPMFMLIWFARKPIRDQMRGWKAAPPTTSPIVVS